MNSVVAEWLRPWEFVSRASCWRGQDDLFGAHGKVKPAGLPIPPRLTTEATVLTRLTTGGHVLLPIPRLTTEATRA